MKVKLIVLFEGFRQSHSRIKDAKNQKEIDQVFIALFESLNWIYTIDNRIRSINTLAGVESDFSEVMRAVRYARNRVQHQWAEIIYYRDGATLPATLPLAFFEWVWMPLDKVPQLPDNSRYDDPVGKEMYSKHLEKQPVRYSLDLINLKIEEIKSQNSNLESL